MNSNLNTVTNKDIILEEEEIESDKGTNSTAKKTSQKNENQNVVSEKTLPLSDKVMTRSK